ncbi:hypothetical protein EOK75_01595 [Pseudorhodobacter turbinis]|uniref:Uncharacterized protein n=2 Tax=Pseudorhodobacter turbinis TaxID=2500533 RepID=A0A4P8EDZ6_9RHOB|nr:hypothetical protein EOK75_01595 [Pseudorhodobacter turbinis]
MVILLDDALTQIDLLASERGLARHYRIGALARGVDDPNVVHRIEAFSGIGLRPYSPAHLRAKSLPGGDREVTWVRRTRIDGDSWESFEVPLGETQEQYLVRIVVSGAIVREQVVTQPSWTYSNAQFAADAAAGGTLMVAQISDRFGPGPFASMSLAA